MIRTFYYIVRKKKRNGDVVEELWSSDKGWGPTIDEAQSKKRENNEVYMCTKDREILFVIPMPIKKVWI